MLDKVLYMNPPLSYKSLRGNDLLTPEEVARALGVSRLSIYRYIGRGLLKPSLKIGKKGGMLFFTKRNIETFRSKYKVKRGGLPVGRPRKEVFLSD
jgi:predicted DNA-binding transcriptional regulator AlpA